METATMFRWDRLAATGVIVGMVLLGPSRWTAAQPKAAEAPKASAGAASDAEQKAKILQSDCWRRAMFELSEWLRIQSVYPPDEVARIKADFSARVEKMSAVELQFVLTDLEAKFRILDSPEAREVRAWLGNYLSIISDRRRDELLKTIPDFATMNSQQLQQTINRLAQRRESRLRTQSAFESVRTTKTNPWQQSAPIGRPSGRSNSGYRSPYRPPSFERPFDNVPAAETRNRMVDPYGRIWLGI
jgi:hypothetical protein